MNKKTTSTCSKPGTQVRLRYEVMKAIKNIKIAERESYDEIITRLLKMYHENNPPKLRGVTPLRN